MKSPFPTTQRAVQLVGPDELVLNTAKPVPAPGPRQLLCRVEAVGLCFSDLKLLKQFTAHTRKSDVVAGIDPGVLAEIPSYVPRELPTVPGHEAVVRVAAVGAGVASAKPGERYLVQTDYRWLRTATSNAAFGYNFEGALQEYVLMDERVITSPAGESMLIPVSESFSSSAVALVEPWACVEDAYASGQRQTLRADGRMLVVAEAEFDQGRFAEFVRRYGGSPDITYAPAADLADLEDASYDDIVYLGASADAVEALFPKLAANGLFLIALCGDRFARPVAAPVGRVHYAGQRIIGTAGSDLTAAMAAIPPSGEVRPGDRVNIIGAAGPMGVMHVVRCLCQGVPGIDLCAGDLDDARLASLQRLAAPLAASRGLSLTMYNPSRDRLARAFQYLTVMVPAPALVAQAVTQAAPHAIINVFAGIPAQVSAEIDLNAYVEKQCYFIGTSGSLVADMHAVLARLSTGALDTDLSVAAVSGLEGAIDGIRAIEKNQLPGKVVVYPTCRGLGLTPLPTLPAGVASHLANGAWNRQAEQALLEMSR